MSLTVDTTHTHSLLMGMVIDTQTFFHSNVFDRFIYLPPTIATLTLAINSKLEQPGWMQNYFVRVIIMYYYYCNKKKRPILKFKSSEAWVKMIIKTLLGSIQASWLSSSLPLLSHITARSLAHSLTHSLTNTQTLQIQKIKFQNIKFRKLLPSSSLSLSFANQLFTVKTLILHFIWHFQINSRYDRRPSSRCWPGAFKSSLRRHFQSPLLQSQ